jgi:hypothetical protein
MFGAARKTTLLTLLAVVAGLLCISRADAASGPIFGFNDTAQTFAAHAKAAKRAGSNIARIPVSWEVAEPQPGHFNWAWLDGAVEALRARGIRPLFVLSAAPRWAAPDCDRTVTATCGPGEGYEDYYVRIALQLLQRYPGGQIQSWNEPNISAFGWLAPERVAELTNLLYRVAPKKVIGPGASPGAPDFMRYTAAAYEDINRHVPMAFNCYPLARSGDGSLRTYWHRARSLADGRAIWVTEIGFPVSTYGEGGQARESAYAYRYLDDHHARAIIFHRLQDPVTAHDAWEGSLGLLSVDGAPKPAFGALRRAVLSDR